MRIFKTKSFHYWASKNKLSDNALLEAVKEMNEGQFEANLGGCLYKKRIAISSRGKRSGLRTILAFKKGDRAFFVYGFAKNKLENIAANELAIYKKMAKLLLRYDDVQINLLLKTDEIMEI